VEQETEQVGDPGGAESDGQLAKRAPGRRTAGQQPDDRAGAEQCQADEARSDEGRDDSAEPAKKQKLDAAAPNPVPMASFFSVSTPAARLPPFALSTSAACRLASRLLIPRAR